MFSAMVIVPANSLKRPRTLETTRCLTRNSTVEWIGSIVQTPGVRPIAEALVGTDIYAYLSYWIRLLAVINNIVAYANNSLRTE